MAAALRRGGPQPKHFDHSAPYLPPPTASNFVYGIGGVYRFESTNAFTGTGALSIAYSPAEVAGLEEESLRLYRLNESSNRWVLVGGTSVTASNLVTATITSLGTYAVAPPLPTGNLWLQPSTNTLVADGVSQMTVAVTNILLNTGEILCAPPYTGPYGTSATQSWLFTVSASGVEVLNTDLNTNLSGVQVSSTNGTVTLRLRAPVGARLRASVWHRWRGTPTDRWASTW